MLPVTSGQQGDFHWCAQTEKAGMKSRVSFFLHPAIPRVRQGALPGSGLPPALRWLVTPATSNQQANQREKWKGQGEL